MEIKKRLRGVNKIENSQEKNGCRSRKEGEWQVELNEQKKKGRREEREDKKEEEHMGQRD